MKTATDQTIPKDTRTQERLESLLRISQYRPKSTQDLIDYALHQALALTASKIGYIYFYDEAAHEFILNSWSRGVMAECTITNPQTRYQLDKTGIWGEAVRQRRPIVVNDFQAPHPLKRGYPQGHAPLSRFMTIPLIFDDAIKAVVGVANKDDDYDDLDVMQLQLLMASAWNYVERQREHERLVEALQKLEQASNVKSEFIANMSHELRSPMNGIIGALELMANFSNPTEAKEELGLLRKSADHMLRMLNDILEFSRIESNSLRIEQAPVAVHDLMHHLTSLIEPMCLAKGITLRSWALTEIPTEIVSDSSRIEQVVLNLLTNAVKFTRNGGSITLRASWHPNSGTSADGAHRIRFVVSDTGIGIKPEHREKIFERFFQSDMSTSKGYQGLGLGLTISKKITELMNGSLSLESEVGRGSTFTFEIPVSLSKRIS